MPALGRTGHGPPAHRQERGVEADAPHRPGVTVRLPGGDRVADVDNYYKQIKHKTNPTGLKIIFKTDDPESNIMFFQTFFQCRNVLL